MPSGYSGTPLPQKLGIKPGHTVALLSAPPNFESLLSPVPTGVTIRRDAKGTRPLDVAVLFAKSRADLEKRFGKVAERLDPAGGFWVAWPKKASGVATDLTEDLVRALALSRGLVDNKVCAIDETWSGLRLVYRLKDRPPTRSNRDG
jgi:hypothetical protein